MKEEEHSTPSETRQGSLARELEDGGRAATEGGNTNFIDRGKKEKRKDGKRLRRGGRKSWLARVLRLFLSGTRGGRHHGARH